MKNLKIVKKEIDNKDTFLISEERLIKLCVDSHYGDVYSKDPHNIWNHSFIYMLGVNTVGDFGGTSLELNANYDWEIGRDSRGVIILIPLEADVTKD